MKLKKLFFGALMTVIVAPVMGQAQQQDPIMVQATEYIKSGNADGMKTLAKENKKNVDGLVSIGKAYLAAKDYAKAKLYAQQAADMVAKSGATNATPFVLLGNIAVGEDNGGEAASQFQQAMYFDPKNPDGYRRYAQIMSKTDPSGATTTLEKLHSERPDIDINMIAAEIHYSAGNVDETLNYLDKVGKQNLDQAWIGIYAGYQYAKNNIEKTLEIANYGHQKFPKDITCNRLLMMVNTDKKDYDAALAAANDLFQVPADSLKAMDFGTWARALEGAKKYDEAISTYEKFQQLKDAPLDQKNMTFKAISDCYKKLSDYDKAGEYLDKWVKSQDKQSFTLEEAVASLYADQLADDNTSAEGKKVAYEKADAIYAKLAEKYPDNAAYIANKRATMPFALGIDQLAALKIAGPHYATFADLLAADANRTAGQTKMLINAYNTLVAYYVHCANDMDKAKEVSQKLIELDPENASAKAVLGIN